MKIIIKELNKTDKKELLREIKNRFITIKNETEIGQVVLNYEQATTLHTCKYMSGDETKTTHIVKDLFFLNNGLANCEHKPEEYADSICYIPLKKKSRGYQLPINNLLSIEIEQKQQNDYTKEWQAIAGSMRKYKINLNVADSIDDYLSGKTDKINGFGNWYTKKDKPKTLSFADVLRLLTGTPQINIVGMTTKEWNKAIISHVNKNAMEKMISHATETNYGYKHHSITKYGMKRDRSVSIRIYPDGSIKYYAASEFAGCGNGDYYVMYSPTMALYAERD